MISIKFKTLLISSALVLLESHNLYAAPLSAKDVLTSSAEFYPEILKNIEGIKQAQYNIQSADGVFDTHLSSDISDRTIGYYDGSYIDTKIEKPLRGYNASIYTGYRIADGTFPIYEDENVTTNNGEYYIGAKVSLLRDRDIDEKRFKLNQEILKAGQASIKLKIKQINVQKNALSAYWKWVAAGHRYHALAELLNLAEKRQKQLKHRVESGDLAEIYVEENKQYILTRKVKYNDAYMAFKKAAQDLSLYYRDNAGKPKQVTSLQVPSFKRAITESQHYSDEDLLNHPLFDNIAFEKKRLHQEAIFRENNLLPHLDLNIKAANDFDDNNRARDKEEVTVKLNFSVPLQRNTAKANLEKAQSQLIQLSYTETLLLEKAKITFQKLLIALRNSRQNISLKRDEVSLAYKMLQAEKQRFENGISDFFLVNLREENITKAKLELIKEKQKFLLALAQIYAITVNEEALNLI